MLEGSRAKNQDRSMLVYFFSYVISLSLSLSLRHLMWEIKFFPFYFNSVIIPYYTSTGL